jgi:hypothetical protein
MTDREKLFLHEEVMLLALAEESGKVELGAWYHQAVGAAVLAELLLAGRVHLVEQGRKTLVEAIGRQPLGDALLDEWLERIASDPERRKVGDWTHRISGTKDLRHRVAAGLVRRSILRCEEDKVLLLFSRKLYPELDPRPERAIRERLRLAIFGDAPPTDPRTVVLLSLAKGTGLLGVVFDKGELKRREDRIERITRGELVGEAAHELVHAATVALVTSACITTVIVH